MASTDNEIINVRERPLSTDLMTMQDLLGRTMVELWAALGTRRKMWLGVDVNPISQVRNVVPAGLDVIGQDPVSAVFVNSGALMQSSNTILPVPGTYDSGYRVSFLRTGVQIAIPTPVADTYYLLEAQMVSAVTVTGLRDILNPGTGVFNPTLVDKVAEQSIQFQLTAGVGTEAPLPAGGDWVPIALIKQLAGGGGIPNDRISDLREAVQDIGNGGVAPGLTTISDGHLIANSKITPIDAYTYGVGIRATGTMPLTGLSFTGIGGADFVDPQFREVGLVYTINTRYYIYLAPWADTGLMPFNSVFTGVANGSTRGILVISANPPVVNGNGSVITLPSPWGAAVVPVGAAAYIGCVVHAPFGLLGFIPVSSPDLSVFNVPFHILSAVSDNVVAGTIISGTYDVAPYVPPTAITVRIRVDLTTSAGTPTHYNMSYGTGTVQATLPPNGAWEFDYPVLSAGFQIPYDIARVGGGNVDAAITQHVTGWSE